MHRVRGKLDVDGAIVKVLIGASSDEDPYLLREGEREQFATTALIDTGASITAVAPFVVEYLGVVHGDFTQVLVPGQLGAMEKKTHRLYDLGIALEAHPRFVRLVRAVGAMPATPGVSVLIGRDILDQCRFLFDGQRRRFTLWF